ncbi:MAG: hypothetical protein IPN76_18010 [Saprospiraceae bacterium]|nr:hypothetical protein [Saprospiraceae bacterium]
MEIFHNIYVSGSTFIQEVPVSGFLSNGTYEINGDQMTTQAETGEPGTANILKLDAEDMELEIMVNEVIADPSGFDVTTTGTYYYTLKKQ